MPVILLLLGVSCFVTNETITYIQGYNLVRCDHPVNPKRNGVGISYKMCPPLLTLPKKIITNEYQRN